MTSAAALAAPLTELLGLAYPPVAITFNAEPASSGGENFPAQPAGCCFWEPAQRQSLDTRAADHANCSTGSYTHGLMDLAAVAHLPVQPASIRYEPLTAAASPDVVLVRLSPSSLMTLQGACPDLRLATRPQCQIIPLAYSGQIAVSPGCAISRLRTRLPDDEMTCALPGESLPAVIERLEQAVYADHAAVDHASSDLERFGGNP